MTGRFARRSSRLFLRIGTGELASSSDSSSLSVRTMIPGEAWREDVREDRFATVGLPAEELAEVVRLEANESFACFNGSDDL